MPCQQRNMACLRSAHDLHKNMKTPGKLSDSTIHLKVNILKSVLREAVRQGLLDQNPFDRLPSSYRIHPHYKEKETLTREDLITLKQTPCKAKLVCASSEVFGE